MLRTATALAATTVVATAVLAGCAMTSGHPRADGPSGTPSTEAYGSARIGNSAATDRPEADPSAARPVVVLDPGHNGGNATHRARMTTQVPAGFGQYKDCNTVGTQTNDGYPEHTFNFDVATRVRALLARRGVEVRMTRPDDAGVGPCVNDRAATGNRARADAVVSIHADGSLSGHGFHVIEAERAPAGPTVAPASHRLAEAVHDRYLAESGFAASTYAGHDGYNRRTDLAGLNLSTRPTILIECGNMRDANDARLMTSPGGRQRIATAIAEGIEDYLRHR
jgi:N-acetylmuramoyl-L-alanine amidase